MKLFTTSQQASSASFLPWVAGVLLLLPVVAVAQREGDGPPTMDPFKQRVVAARAVPGGRYAGHAYVAAQRLLTIRATDGSTRQIQEWANGVIKVNYFAPGLLPVADSSLSVVQAAESTLPHALTDRLGRRVTSPVTTTADGIQFLLHGGIVLVDKKTLRVRTFHYQYQQSGDTGYHPILTFSEEDPAFRRTAAPPTAAATSEPGGTAVRFRLAPGERLYGTGARALPVDRRGYRLELYNQAHYAYQNGEPNLNVTLPVVLSSRGYLLLFDHHTAAYLDLGKTDKKVLEYSGENLTSLSYYVVTGENQAEILNRYTALTGRQPLPPRWALGLIQSRFGYRSQAETEAVAARMRRENFPLDALVHDLYWFGGIKNQGDLTWDKANFPDPAGMMRGLNEKGVKTILISEPYVMRASRNDSTVRTLGLVGTDATGKPFTVASFWAGPASILDVFKPSARAWLWSYYQQHHDQGATGWWSDLGEPENHPEAMHHATGPTRAVHNAYGMAWASIFAENYAKEYPNERLFNLARSGWAGMQRNSVFPWSGDVQRTWSGFRAQVPIMLGMSAVGVGYMHSDAGGFCVGGIDSELYTRWLQMASLCPILRPHGEGVPPEPYFYPEPYKSAVRNATHLRYELLPYLYTLAWQNTTTGAPLVRAMDYDAPFELVALKPADDQYLLGPNLLVAPVLHPGQRRRNVALPSGKWIDFYTNQAYDGSRTISLPAPLAHTPLLVRAGAFLPMTTYHPSTAQYRPDTLLLRYYPDPQASASVFTMYDDDGHSAQALAKRQYETLTMRGFCNPAQTDVILSSNGEYPGQPVYRFLRLLVQRVAAPPTQVLFDNEATPAEAWAYDPVKHELEVHFLMNAGVAVSLRGLTILPAENPGSAPETLTLEGPDNRTFGAGGTTLYYTRHAAGAATPLRIRNAQGVVIRTLVLAGGLGPQASAWDGRDAQGRSVTPGVYVAEAAGQHQRLIVTR